MLVPAPGPGAVATVDGRLPAFDVTLEHRESTVAAAQRALAAISLTRPILHCAIDQRPDEQLGASARTALVVVEPPGPSWTPPAGWAWSGEPALHDDLPDPLARIAHQWIGELTGATPTPELRAAWSRPGWHAAATAWIDDALRAAGRPPSTSVVPVRQWGISTVLRVETTGERCWLKATFPGFRQETEVTEWLDRTVPGAVPPVIAAHHDRGWLLLGDLGDRTQADDAETTREAIDRLVAVQRSTAGRTCDLLALGAPDRRPGRLVADLVDAVGSAVASELLVRADARALAAPLALAVARLDGVLPDGLVHGDFHPGNVAATGDGTVLFDWSDVAISCPVVDIPTWTWWYPDDPDRVEHVWTCFEAAWHRAHGVAPGSIDRRAATAVAAAYHTISYVRILEGVEPTARPEHADGLAHFWELLRRTCGDDR